MDIQRRRWGCVVSFYLLGLIFLLLVPSDLLADEAPWPMYQRDPQHTGRSPYVGPGSSGVPDVRTLIQGQSGGFIYAPLIGPNEILYLPARINGQEGVYTFDRDGTQKWFYPATIHGLSANSLALTPEGDVFFCVDVSGGNIDLITLRPDGSIKWQSSSSLIGAYPIGYPSITYDGIIYLLANSTTGNSGKLIAIDSTSGEKIWEYVFDGNILNDRSLAIGYDSTIYFGHQDTLYAVNPDGSEKWKRKFIPRCQYFTCNPRVEHPSIRDDGTIYVMVSQEEDWRSMQDEGMSICFHAIDPENPFQDKWANNCSSWFGTGPPAISSTGNLYFPGGYAVWTWMACLFGFSPQGNNLENWPLWNVESSFGGPLLIDGSEIIYVFFNNRLKAYNQQGEEKLSLYLDFGGCCSGGSSLSMDNRGTLYAGYGKCLYAISPGPTRNWAFNTDFEYNLDNDYNTIEGRGYLKGTASLSASELSAQGQIKFDGTLPTTISEIYLIATDGEDKYIYSQTLTPGQFNYTEVEPNVFAFTVSIPKPIIPINDGHYEVWITLSGYDFFVNTSSHISNYYLPIEKVNPPPPPEPNIPALLPKLEPNTPEQDKLIIITHGWKPPWDKSEGPGWVERTYDAINSLIASGEIGSSWKVEMWNWPSDTIDPWGAQYVGKEYGKLQGDAISIPSWKHIHLICHSAGASVIAAAAEVLTKSRTEGNFTGDIHLTFLDPFTSFGKDEKYCRTLDFSRDWADNYHTVDFGGDVGRSWNVLTWTDSLFYWTSRNFDYAHNVDISTIDHSNPNNHNFPCDWYYATITGHYPDDGPPLDSDNIFEGRQYGFQRSLESGDVNWQESLSLPVGNKPAIGSLTQRMMKSVSKLNQGFNNSIVQLKEQNKGVILLNILKMWTNSPMWGQVLVQMPPGTNSVKFTYQFTGDNPAYLTVYFNENLILIGDQRFDGNTPHESPQILVADYMREDNWLTFRIDEINEPNAEVSISNLEIGTITTKTDINADLIVNFTDFAAFAQQWTAIDCNNENSWCGGSDFDEDGAVDIKDAAALALSWLWTPPKRIQADLNFTGTVDFFDFNIFAGQWGGACNSPDWCYGSDFDKSGTIDILDLLELTRKWLEGI